MPEKNFITCFEPDVEWRYVVGHPSYAVTVDGRVLSAKRARGRDRFRYMTPTPNKRGYLKVTLDRETRHIHRLVLEAFVGPCPEGMEGCHNNGDNSDNNLSNLRWDTHSANSLDKNTHGTQCIVKVGEENPRAILTERDVVQIKLRLATGEEYLLIAADYHVGVGAIGAIKLGKNWAHVL